MLYFPRRESCSLTRSLIQRLCTVSSAVGRRGDRNRSDLHTRQLCFLQLFLRHTLRGTLRRTRWCGYALASDRTRETGGREGARERERERKIGCRCRGQHSRVFLVPIHNCKFPSPYLCSPSSHRPGLVCRFANTGLSTANSSVSDSQGRVGK